MAYSPFTWQDSKAGGTPITAARLNSIEQGLNAAAGIADTAFTATQGLKTSLDSTSGQISALSGRLDTANTFAVATLPANQDMNNLKTPGFYRWGGDGSWMQVTNGPASLGNVYPFGIFNVTAANGSISQTYIPDGTNGIYSRSTWNGSWSAWQYILNASQVSTAAYAAVDDRLAGRLNVRAFGAKGDGATDDTDAIQSALDVAGNRYKTTGAITEVYVPAGVYIMRQNTWYNPSGGADGGCSLVLRSGTRFRGEGILKMKNGAWGNGSHHGIIKSEGQGISDSSIEGLRLDGNRSNNVSSQQNSNIVIYVGTNVRIQNVTSYAADGEGIQVLGPYGGGQCNNVKILNNHVQDCNRIGIQVSHFNDLLIDGNTVMYCGNNCIDIYGDISGSQNGDGTNFAIVNNYTRNGLSGIFPETVTDGVIANNRCDSMSESGIHVNRSWSQTKNFLITGNYIRNVQFGILFTGDMNGITVRGNYIVYANQAGVKLGQDGYRCSYVQVIDNTINTNQINATPLVLFTGPQVVGCRVRGTITDNTDRGWDNVFYNLGTNVNNTVSPANAT